MELAYIEIMSVEEILNLLKRPCGKQINYEHIKNNPAKFADT